MVKPCIECIHKKEDYIKAEIFAALSKYLFFRYQVNVILDLYIYIYIYIYIYMHKCAHK